MKLRFLTLILVIALTEPAWARLGENQDQLAGRYGNPQVLSKGESGGVPVDISGFKKTGFQIYVSLLNNVSVCEEISKISHDPITEDEIKTLLSINSQGHAWKEATAKPPMTSQTASPQAAAPSQREWLRDDGAVAKLEANTTFTVESKDLLDAQAAAYKTAHATSLDGF